MLYNIYYNHSILPSSHFFPFVSLSQEKNASYESFQVANDVITVALFGPDCTHRSLDSISTTAAAAAVASTEEPLSVAGGSGLRVNIDVGGSSKSKSGLSASAARGQVILAAGYSGEINIYENIGLPQWL